ncbi:hypothetical protein E2R60_20525 [Paenibacillus dendritiformis]|uniref:hypothetical protein n=1 Tax=Paenibacillus dendritiformis TaxID=130049 RepID=UPI0010593E9A|nr:hypothetical protein [Paenibacillus dendritiformis]TDL50935.1 hypothetical protein E2R60_20525 [Paenibacillus dendritiformis]
MPKEIQIDGAKFRVSNVRRLGTGKAWADVEKYYPQIDKWFSVQHLDCIRKVAEIAIAEGIVPMIRARVHEIQWGNSVMPYVRYFESQAAIEAFQAETGYRIEVL